MEKLKFKKLSSVETEVNFNSNTSQHFIVEDGGNIKRLNSNNVYNNITPEAVVSATEEMTLAQTIQVRENIGAGEPLSDEQLYTAAGSWLSENLATPSTPPIDSTLSVENAAADAKAVGDAISAEASARDAAIANNVDETLSVFGKAADAKVTGDAISNLNLVSGEATGVLLAQWEPGYFEIGAVGTVVSLTRQASITPGSFVSAVLSVEPGGGVINLNTLGGGTTNGGARAYAALDSDKNVIERSGKDREYDYGKVTFPATAAYIVLNTKTSVAGYYAYIGQSVDQRVSDVLRYSSQILSDTQSAQARENIDSADETEAHLTHNGERMLSALDFFQGTANGSDFTDSSDSAHTKRIRTQKLAFGRGDRLMFSPGIKANQMYLVLYDRAGTRTWDSSVYCKIDTEFIFDSDCRAAIFLRTDDGTETISPADYDATIKLVTAEKDVRDDVMFCGPIMGAKLTWEQGFIDNNGANTSQGRAIRTDYINVPDKAKWFKYTGPSKLDDKDVYVRVYQYKSDNTFIMYKYASYWETGGFGRYPIRLESECGKIRIAIRYQSSSTTLNTNQGGLFAGEFYTDQIAELDIRVTALDETGSTGGIARRMRMMSIPESLGALNVVRRARQMTDIKWTPAVDLPRLELVQRWPYPSVGLPEGRESEYRKNSFKAGVEYTGIPYGRSYDYTPQLRANGSTTFVGLDVPIETFITAVRNENSLICEQDRFNLSTHVTTLYSLVCSAFVSWALGLSWYTTENIPSIPSLTSLGLVKNGNDEFDLRLLKHGDVLLISNSHAAIITDIQKDSMGNVVAIEISEATTLGNGDISKTGTQQGGICRRMGWLAEDFYKSWGAYTIYRYGNISSVTYTQNQYVDVGDGFPAMLRVEDFACLPHEGNNFTYKIGYIPNNAVKILINSSGYSKLRVFKDGVEISASPYVVTNETEYINVETITAGSYEAYLCNIVDDVVKQLTATCHWTIE